MTSLQSRRCSGWPLACILFVFLAVTAGVAVFSGAARAADDQLVIVIDDGAEYEGDLVSGRFEVRGGVTVSYRNVSIRAWELTIVSGEDGRATAEFRGGVEVTQGEQTFTGDSYTFNLPSGTSYLVNARGTLDVARATEPVLFTARVMRNEGGYLVLEDSRFTTCSCTEKGYYLSASSMEIYPGDRVVLHQVRFVDFGITLFYWPRLTIPMDDPGFLSRILPGIGYNQTDGWYVRYNHAYGLGGLGEGILHLDWVQHRGFGVGTTHTYRENDTGKGEVEAYALLRPGLGLASVELGWRERYTGPALDLDASLNWEMDGPPGDREQTLRGDLSLRYESLLGDSRLDLAVERDLTGSLTDRDRLRMQAEHQVMLGSEGTRLRLAGDVFLERTPSNERRFYGYEAALSGTLGAIAWTLRADRQFNPAVTQQTNVDWLTTGRWPEVVLSYRPASELFGQRLPLQFEFGWGRYSEVRREGSALVDQRLGRTTLFAGVQNYRLPVGEHFTLTWSGSVQGYRYEGGLDRLVVNSDLRGTLRLTQALTLDGRYQYRKGFGAESPFRFDRTSDVESVSGTLSYRTPGVQLSLSGGYNLLTQRPSDLRFSLDGGPWWYTSIRFQTTYNLVTREFRTAAAALQFEPGEGLGIRLGGQYDFSLNTFTRIDASIDWAFGEWKVGYQAIYYPTRPLEERFAHGNLSLLRILDECRELGISFDQASQTVWLEYRIFAFPDTGVRVGSGASGMMFDLEGWQELIGG